MAHLHYLSSTRPSSFQHIIYKLSLLTVTGALLASCNGIPHGKTASRSPGGYYKIGAPYQINGTWYYPKQEPHYKEDGVASWYGSDFHNKHTANGDMFDKRALTAAHRTLPLPSMVQVTNLDNGKSLVLMVNDRGPFSKNRILDVSERAAEVLGFKAKGTAQVRVQNLPVHSQRLLSDLNAAKSQSTLLVENHYNAESGTQEEYILEQTGATVSTSDTEASSESSRPRSFSRRLKDMFSFSKKEAPAPAAPETPSSPADSALEPEHITEPADTMPASSSSTEAPVTTPAENTPVTSTPAETTTPAATSGPVTPTTSDAPQPAGSYYIQVGAYGNSHNASRASQTLSAVGEVESKEITMRGKQVTRIRIGPFIHRSDAENLLQRVHDSGYKDALVTKE